MGLRFPQSLREHYLRANGGYPEPYIYEDDNVDTAVQACLPLRRGKGSAIDVYEDHVLSKAFVPRHLFPFARDPGGDNFYVDTLSPLGMVYLYRHDVGTGEEPLVALNVGIDEFWSRLKPDE